MKLLIISPYLPHRLSGHGTGVFMYGLLKRLTTRHDVTFVSFCDQKELLLAEDLKTLPMKLYTIPREKGKRGNIVLDFRLALVRAFQLLRSIVLWQPYYVSKWKHSRMSELITRLTEKNEYDIVQFEVNIMGQYAKCVRGGKTVLHMHDVSYRPAYRLYKSTKISFKKLFFWIEWCRWYRYECRIVKLFNQILTVTDQDRNILERLTGLHHISYFPRGIETPKQIPSNSARMSQSLLFIGTFSHIPNVDAVKWLVMEIFPIVLRRYPQTELTIIGPNPPSDLVSQCKFIENIKFLGFVENIEDHLMRSSIFVAPLRSGGGVKVKILQAMAYGIPVITTKVGVEGIEGIMPECPIVGDSVPKIADHVCNLFKDQKRAEEIGKMGYHIINKYYSWTRIISCLENIYSNIS